MRVYNSRGQLITGSDDETIGSLMVNGNQPTPVQDFNTRILLEQILLVLMEIKDELKERR